MRNNEGRTDFELVGTSITMQVHKILKCSEPFVNTCFPESLSYH